MLGRCCPPSCASPRQMCQIALFGSLSMCVVVSFARTSPVQDSVSCICLQGVDWVHGGERGEWTFPFFFFHFYILFFFHISLLPRTWREFHFHSMQKKAGHISCKIRLRHKHASACMQQPSSPSESLVKRYAHSLYLTETKIGAYKRFFVILLHAYLQSSGSALNIPALLRLYKKRELNVFPNHRKHPLIA